MRRIPARRPRAAPALDLAELPTVTRLENGGAHVYAAGENFYPSATSLIGRLWPYRGPERAVAPEAARGTRIHANLADLALGWEVEVEEADEPWLASLARHIPSITAVHAVEAPMAVPYGEGIGLGGTADLVCTRDGALTVIDWKTKSAEPDDEALRWHHVQAAAYGLMWRHATGNLPSRTTVIWATRDGGGASTVDAADNYKYLGDAEAVKAVIELNAGLGAGA